ncbi:hypothetical protein BESB_015280 [Besnoitia besnoiti]|uniref:Uncharacterized protein n=1 Tax=Besnoitia besnoiti TaxID=94643 RepID=A0A2A9M4M0_BESBE|nr:hypothetical protein BESB_015280 [Besnoitia besnoiti]PFH32915.1 hypothetical protein BESB_015280 [Besnoitia besnoiti]
MSQPALPVAPRHASLPAASRGRCCSGGDFSSGSLRASPALPQQDSRAEGRSGGTGFLSLLFKQLSARLGACTEDSRSQDAHTEFRVSAAPRGAFAPASTFFRSRDSLWLPTGCGREDTAATPSSSSAAAAEPPLSAPLCETLQFSLSCERTPPRLEAGRSASRSLSSASVFPSCSGAASGDSPQSSGLSPPRSHKPSLPPGLIRTGNAGMRSLPPAGSNSPLSPYPSPYLVSSPEFSFPEGARPCSEDTEELSPLREDELSRRLRVRDAFSASGRGASAYPPPAPARNSCGQRPLHTPPFAARAPPAAPYPYGGASSSPNAAAASLAAPRFTPAQSAAHTLRQNLPPQSASTPSFPLLDARPPQAAPVVCSPTQTTPPQGEAPSGSRAPLWPARGSVGVSPASSVNPHQGGGYGAPQRPAFQVSPGESVFSRAAAGAYALPGDSSQGGQQDAQTESESPPYSPFVARSALRSVEFALGDDAFDLRAAGDSRASAPPAEGARGAGLSLARRGTGDREGGIAPGVVQLALDVYQACRAPAVDDFEFSVVGDPLFDERRPKAEDLSGGTLRRARRKLGTWKLA